jgi:TonB family protein
MQQESKFNRFVMISATLHVGLLAGVFLGPALLPAETKELWGSETGIGESMPVGVVDSLPGIPLPSPEVVRDTAAPTDSETLHPPEPSPPKPVPVQPAVPDVLIPSKTATKAKPDPQPAPVTPPRGEAPADTPPPSNAVPGTGGRAAVPYGQSGTGTGPASFGDEAFGHRFGTYVTAMTNAIRQNWQQPATGAAPGKPPRVYVTFTIARDGKVDDVKIQQPSGNSRLDSSAQRAVMAAKLPPLPREYTGSSVAVRFYFEYGR